jgi:ABC-type sugar transport system ATPase subunit
MIVKLRREAERVTSLVRQLSIRAPSIDTWVKYLSGGTQQKILIARALCSQAGVLLLDEPTAGVDIGAKSEIYRLLDGLAEKGGAIVMTSSDITELIGMSDRMIVMRHGRVVTEVESGQMTPEMILRQVQGV